MEKLVESQHGKGHEGEYLSHSAHILIVNIDKLTCEQNLFTSYGHSVA